MHRFLILVGAILALTLSKSTIDDTERLFLNTIKRWNVQIRDKRDHSERYRRLVQMKRSVDETTSGVMLDSLNRFAVNNDEEHAALMALTRRAANMTLSVSRRSSSSEGEHDTLRKREVEWEQVPEEYNYWEKELGMSEPQDQQGCGSCWAFPNAAAMEAVYKKLTGEFVVFSKQYFIDCTFSYSGCAGGTVNEGYKLTKDRQYLMSEEDWPLTTDYQPCKFHDRIRDNVGNAMRKAWFQDWYPLNKNEEALIKGLKHSPVAFGGYISQNYYAYSEGVYDDSECATAAIAHSQLLVGYTKTTLRVRGSYGVFWGDKGYINYKRGSPNLGNCRLFDAAYSIVMTHRKHMEYELCNDGKLTTRAKCRTSCLEMNKEGKRGWDLAVIPTVHHNTQIVNMINARWPGKKSDDKFNLLWTGLSDPEKSMHFFWTDGRYEVNYFNYTRSTGFGKFGLLNKNDGGWQMKSSTNFQARGLCSRARTCHDISSRVQYGTVKFSTEDADNLEEGTTAKITCPRKCKLEGAGQVECVGGHWYKLDFNHNTEDPDHMDYYKEEEQIPNCVCPDSYVEKEKKKKDKKKRKISIQM